MTQSETSDQEAGLPTRWVVVRAKCKTGWRIVGTASTKLGVWLLSVLALIAAPCLPLIIELLKTGSVKSENIYITASVMCIGFVFMAENMLIRVVYIAIFALTLIFDIVSGPFSKELNSFASLILIGVCVLHASERLYWHIGLDRPFPERTL